MSGEADLAPSPRAPSAGLAEPLPRSPVETNMLDMAQIGTRQQSSNLLILDILD